MQDDVVSSTAVSPLVRDWVDQFLLDGPSDEIILRFERPVDRDALRRLVADHHRQLADAGLASGGHGARRRPPSPTWRCCWPAGGSAPRSACSTTGSASTRWTWRWTGWPPSSWWRPPRPPAAGCAATPGWSPGSPPGRAGGRRPRGTR